MARRKSTISCRRTSTIPANKFSVIYLTLWVYICPRIIEQGNSYIKFTINNKERKFNFKSEDSLKWMPKNRTLSEFYKNHFHIKFRHNSMHCITISVWVWSHPLYRKGAQILDECGNFFRFWKLKHGKNSQHPLKKALLKANTDNQSNEQPFGRTSQSHTYVINGLTVLTCC